MMEYYIHERNYGCRLSDNYTFKGLKTIVMENEEVRVSILADKGTSIFEFLYKPCDVDFMWRSPLGIRNPGFHVPTITRSDGTFLEYYEGGWQELLPNGGSPCVYKGAEQGLHGEVTNIPWDYVMMEDNPECVKVKFWVRTYRTPFYLEKTLCLEAGKPILFIEEELLNEGDEEMELMWGHHPAFGYPFLDENCIVDVPAGKVEIHAPKFASSSRLIPGEKYEWPWAKDVSGNKVDLSKIPSADTRSTEVAYLMDFEEGWCALTNAKREIGFGLRWPAEVFRYLWFWQVYRGAFGHPWYGRTYNVALEPWTSYPALGLGEAIRRGTQMRIRSGERVKVSLKAVVYSGLRKVRRIDENGNVEGE